MSIPLQCHFQKELDQFWSWSPVLIPQTAGSAVKNWYIRVYWYSKQFCLYIFFFWFFFFLIFFCLGVISLFLLMFERGSTRKLCMAFITVPADFKLLGCQKWLFDEKKVEFSNIKTLWQYNALHLIMGHTLAIRMTGALLCVPLSSLHSHLFL